MGEVLAWHRRHAIHIASQLPEDPEDALAVLRAALKIPTEGSGSELVRRGCR